MKLHPFKRILLAICFSTPLILNAKAPQTEYYFQPDSQESAFTVLYSYVNTPLEQQTARLNSDLDTEAQDFLLRYEYGLDDKKAIGISSFVGSKKYEATQVGSADNKNTAYGIGDVHFYLEGFRDQIRYSADIGINTDDSKIDQSSGLQDNRTSGAPSLTLNAGRIWNDLSWNYGLDGALLILGERNFSDAANSRERGGNIFRVAGFGEYNFGSGIAGFEVSYNLVDQIRVKSNTGTRTTGSEGFARAVVFGSWILTDNWTAVARLEQAFHNGRHLTPTVGELKGFTETSFSLGFRSNF
jgi:hypothetical protein